MKRVTFWALAAAVASIIGGGFSTSGQAQSPADAPASVAPAARYQVIAYSHNSAVMIEVATGKSWKLERDAEKTGSYVWVPIRKLQTNMELDDWEQRMKKFREERRKRRAADFGEGILPPDIEPFGFRGGLEGPAEDIGPPDAAGGEFDAPAFEPAP